MSEFVVSFKDPDGKHHLVLVDAKDTIHAFMKAAWPVTVWTKEEWDSSKLEGFEEPRDMRRPA